MDHVPFHADYLHHQKTVKTSVIRVLVFGLEDGMVSTMGAITGIAAGTQNYFTVVLSGFVIVAVESISMAVGSYLSSESGRSIDERKIKEEKEELQKYPKEEKLELVDYFVNDGWPRPLAQTMAKVAAKNEQLMLKEMTYRELNVVPDGMESPLRNGLIMGASYIVGGAIPLAPYLFLDVFSAIPVSIVVTLLGLFTLGSYTTKFSKRSWWKAGLEMLGLASAAALVGYVVGQAMNSWWLGRQ